MKQLLLILSLFLATAISSQVRTAGKNKAKIFQDSTTIQKLERIKDSVQNPVVYQDSQALKEEMERNTNNLVRFQKERNASQKKAAFIRIAIGIGFLIILIIGLMRRRRIK